MEPNIYVVKYIETYCYGFRGHHQTTLPHSRIVEIVAGDQIMGFYLVCSPIAGYTNCSLWEEHFRLGEPSRMG